MDLLRDRPADLILRKLFVVPAEQIHGTRVLQTWFAGRLVHDANDLNTAA